jgi:AcrR family transcriptional regulator
MAVYRQFGSKDALVEAWLADTISRYRSVLDELELTHPDSPIEQLRGFATYVINTLPVLASRGCPFVNTIAEIGDSSHPLIKRIAKHKAQQASRILALCQKGGLPSPEVAAAQLTFLLEGAQITAQNGSIADIGGLLTQIVDDLLAKADKPDV